MSPTLPRPWFARSRGAQSSFSFVALSSTKRSRSRALTFQSLEDRALFTLEGHSLFPADSPWNHKITNAPVAANSATLVASVGNSSRLHPDFGTIFEGGNIGIPYNVVSGSQPVVNVVIDAYADESDLVPVPIPAGAVVEGDPLPSADNDSDRHLIVYDKDHRVGYELYKVYRPEETGDHQWHADAEAVWHFDVNWFRTPGDTSADAAGLPILPGLVRPDEVLDQGVITHALRFTVPSSNDSYVFPASHQAGDNNAALPRMGERFRLKASFDTSGYSAANRVILQALKDYGMIVADNGSSWFLSGSPSTRWSDDDLHNLTAILGNNFEVVDLTPVVGSLDQTSGPTSGGTAVTVHGQNFTGTAGQLQVMFGTTPATSIAVLSDTMLVATAPAHASGAVHLRVQSPYGTSAISTSNADQFTFGSGGSAASIVSRKLFYNQSGTSGTGGHYDHNDPAINSFDDAAIATDKVALLPGAGAATFANVSSYSKGINGIVIDLAGVHGTITAADFIFKVGNNNTPSTWTTAPAPTAVSVRAGAGAGGSDRVEITWSNGAIQKQWLEVITRANASTGLAQSATLPSGQADAFFFGNALGDSGLGDTAASATVNSTDEIAARSNPATLTSNIPITNLYDYNRDAQVNGTDQIIARANATTPASVLKFISIANPPAAPAALSTAEATALATSASGGPPSTNGQSASAQFPLWIAERLNQSRQNLDALNFGPLLSMASAAHRRSGGSLTFAADGLSARQSVVESLLANDTALAALFDALS